MFSRLWILLPACLLVACRADRPGCLDNGSSRCVPAAACEGVQLVCSASSPSAFRMTSPGDRRGGAEALGAVGDYVMDNGLIRVVIDDITHPQHLAVSGGNLLDLFEVGGNDALNQISQVTGILPRDAVQYKRLEIRTDEKLADGLPAVSIIARGHLYGNEQILAVTRYTLGACDRGVRIRTEVYNGSREAQAFFLADAMYNGGRGVTPMIPARGQGFSYPELDLEFIEDAFRSYPFISAQNHDGTLEGNVAYAAVSCDRSRLEGVNNTLLSAFGQPRTLVMSGDGMSFERYIAVASGAGSSHVQRIAYDLRQQLLNERFITARGRVRVTPARLDYTERLASLLFKSEDILYAEAVPSSLGELNVALPAGRSYTIERYAFGRLAGPPIAIDVGAEDFDLGDLEITAPARITARVTVDGLPATSELVLVPFDGSAGEEGSIYGQFAGCAPYLGPPHGASPACNRVLARDGNATFDAPPGHYYMYATHGPAATLQRVEVLVASGESREFNLELERLAVFPADSVSADFHVHGALSFDSVMPNRDRVLSFLAADLQVLAATDHDVVGDYTRTIAELGAASLLFSIPAVELTPLVLHRKRDGSSIPRALGHLNFWPMPQQEGSARNGAPWDELKEPGELYDELAGYTGADGVHQLNHPYAPVSVGRDEGYAASIGYDPRIDIKTKPDKTPEGQWLRKPAGGRTNLDHHAQEVMNGADVLNFLEYRTLWHSFLRQGILRTGTANSDSHSLSLEQAGYPRNVVDGRHDFPTLNLATFNQAVREGRLVGTNGPYILARLRDGALAEQGPSLSALPIDGDEVIHLEVRAAPWIPVTELRVLLNGALLRTIPIASVPPDPFGTAGIERLVVDFPVAELAPNGGILVFETGVALPNAQDMDDDGVVDTLDADEDGDIDKQDEEAENPRHTPRPGPNDPRYHVHVVSPRTYPTAFTNPFVLVKP